MTFDGQHRDRAQGIEPDARSWIVLLRSAMAPLSPRQRKEFLAGLRAFTPEQIIALTDDLNARLAKRKAER